MVVSGYKATVHWPDQGEGLCLVCRHTYQSIIFPLTWLHRCCLFSLHLTERSLLVWRRLQGFFWKAKHFFTFAKPLMLKDISSSLLLSKVSLLKTEGIKKWVRQLLFQEMLCLRALETHHKYLGVLWPVKTHVLVLWGSVLCCAELYFLVTST